MIRLFAENRALTVFLLPIFTVGYVLLNAFFPYFELSNEIDFGLFGTYTVATPLVKQIGGGAIVFLNAVAINLVFNNQNFHEKTIYLPAFIYIVWMSFFEEMYNPGGFLLAHTFYILILFQLFRLNQNEDGRKLVFNAAFFAGVATCLHPTMVILLPFLFIMVWILRPFVFRESLLLITGFITPLLYAGVLMLYQHEAFQWNWKLNFVAIENQPFNLFVMASLILLFILFSAFGIRAKLQKSSIRLRKLTRILWVLLFLAGCIGVTDFLLAQQEESFGLLFVILPFFSVFSFVKKPLSVLANGLFIIIIICSLLKFFL